MKRMIPYLIIGIAGLTACGWLVLRHAARTRGDGPAAAGSEQLIKPGENQAIDRWQGGIRMDTRTDYVTEAQARKRTEEKLRAEELRQKPWERRN